MSLVSVEDLRDYMSSISLDPDQSTAVQEVLDGLQRELERYCRRKFEKRERTEVVYPDSYGRLWPKATPVHSVSSPVGLRVDGGNQIVGPYGSAGAGSMFGFDESQGITITYVGGLDPDDAEDDLADVKLAILRAAAREVTDRHDDTLSMKDLDGRDAPTRDREPMGFTERELKKFDRLRRRTVAT